MRNNSLNTLIEGAEFSDPNEECVILDDEQTDAVYGGEGLNSHYDNCSFTNCHCNK